MGVARARGLTDRALRFFRWLFILLLARQAWIIFAYGQLVYRLMGDAAQEKFTRGWGVGLAIGQATQFKVRPGMQWRRLAGRGDNSSGLPQSDHPRQPAPQACTPVASGAA